MADDTTTTKQDPTTTTAAPAAPVVPAPASATAPATTVAGNVVTEAAAQSAAAPGVLTAASLYNTGPTGEPVGPETEASLDWRQGLDHIRETLATDGHTLSHAAEEFVRRVLGELYQHEQGGPPASPAAKEFATTVTGTPSQETADYLNAQGIALQKTEGHGLLNSGGYAV